MTSCFTRIPRSGSLFVPSGPVDMQVHYSVFDTSHLSSDRFTLQKGKAIDRVSMVEITDVRPNNKTVDFVISDGPLEERSSQGSASDPVTGHDHDFTIFTKEDGQKEGRKYHFRAETAEEMRDWIAAILECKSSFSPVTHTPLQRVQKQVQQFYASNGFQILAAIAIMVNFICNAVEAELNPEDGTREADVLETFDYVFVVLFTVELAINIFGNWFFDFVSDAWNWFDTIVVIISLVSKFASDDPGLNVLRTVRAFRVFRLFKRLKSLRHIIRAITASLPAVCNAFFLVILMTMIYAIMGTTFIRLVDPSNFGAFSISMYTMWRIMTFDNAAGITWGVMELVTGYDKLLVALFVVSYQLIVAMILCNIVMAVLLDKFSEASEASKAEDMEEAILALAEQTVSSLDPLLEQLSEVRSKRFQT